MYFPQTDTNYGIYPPSEGEGSSWEVSPYSPQNTGYYNIELARQAVDRIMERYGVLPEGLPDWVYNVAGGLGQPGGPSEEMNVQFDDVTGLPVYDPTSPIIWEQVQMPEQEVGGDGGGAARRPATTTTTTPSGGDSGGIYGPFPGGTGSGVRQITLPTGQVITVPENLNPFQLLAQGLITREIYEQLAGDRAIPEDTPEIVQPTSPVETETGDPLRRPSTDTETSTDTEEPADTEEPIITDIEQPVTTPEVSEVSDLNGGGLRRNMNEEDEFEDGEGSGTGTGTGTGTSTGDGTGTGTGTGDGTGTGEGEGFDYQKFFEAFSQIYPSIPSGASFEEGIVPRILPTALSYGPQVGAFAQLIDRLNREISPKQAETALGLYSDITSGVREAQSPLMKSLARRAEMQGVEAERLMGPLSFLQARDTTQAGYGQTAALGRTLDSAFREQQAGRLREEQRNVNLKLASDLLGQQRATAGLMADIETGIYGRMAPDIGVDPGQIIGISGMDIGNVLGERQGTRAAEAISKGAERQLYAQLAPSGIQAVKTGYDFLKDLMTRNKNNTGTEDTGSLYV